MKYLRIAVAVLYIALICLAPLAVAEGEEGGAPSVAPSAAASVAPSASASAAPSAAASVAPSAAASAAPSAAASAAPSAAASVAPSASASAAPSAAASAAPSAAASASASVDPSASASASQSPNPGVSQADIDAYLVHLASSRTYADYLSALREQLTAYEQSSLLPALVGQLESGRYAQFENGVQSSLESEIATRIQDGSITDAGILSYYKAKRETDILAFISELTDGTVKLGNIRWGSGALKAGDKVVLAVPIVFTPTSGQNSLYSNVSGNSYVNYANQFGVYDNALCSYLEYVRVDMDSSAENFPFKTPQTTSYTLLGKAADNAAQWGLTYDAGTGLYSGLQGDALVNGGFALFEVTVKKDLYTGSYPVNFTAYWTNAQTGKTSATELSATLSVSGKSQDIGGGGYYGGGGEAAPTLSPSTKLYVESISTDPAQVNAGDTFDLVIVIRNTSTEKFVQNMKVTVSATEDALLPVSGSNTVYISRIEKDSAYELRMPVRAKLDLPPDPLKVDVALEYEDSAVTALSATQTLVMEVTPINRLKVSEPSLSTDVPSAGDSYPITIQLANQGRTTIYNVTITSTCDNDQLLAPLPYFVGNMDGGASHKAEISLTPLSEGTYDVTFTVTYENAQGEQFTMDPMMGSFYAQAAETYDYSQYDYDENAQMVTEESASAMDILRKMPWWLYAAAGGLVVCLISLAAVSAHTKRRKALEEDEME